MIAERQWLATLRVLVSRSQDGIDLSTAWRMLEIMQAHGQSIVLSWGEETGQWECAWITGERFTGMHGSLQVAVLFAARKAVDSCAY